MSTIWTLCWLAESISAHMGPHNSSLECLSVLRTWGRSPAQTRYRCSQKHHRISRGRELNTNLFFSNFSGASGLSWQNFGISRQINLISLGFDRHIELFAPPLFTWKTPTPPEDIRTKKFGFGFVVLPEDYQFV